MIGLDEHTPGGVRIECGNDVAGIYPAAGKNPSRNDRGKPLMTSFISLWVWLGLSLVMADESPPSRRPEQTFRVFADLKHKGILTGL